jgi:thiol-disulfide isomerase/thioredoxin
VLIFTSPTCGPCSVLMPEVGHWQRDYAKKLTIVLLSRGSVEDNRTKVSEHHLAHLIIQSQDEIDKLYNVQGTPSAVLIHPDGRIESPLVVGPDDIRALVTGVASWRQLPLVPLIVPGNNQHRVTPEPPRIGTQAPAFSLPDLKSELVTLSSFRGKPTLLLFWNPNCGFCKKMLPDLKTWEADPPHGAPRLLVISEGTIEENRAMGLRSPVVLTRESDVRKLFGATGTPMAILIDTQGRIASTLVVGAPDVLSLLSSATIPVGP